MRRHFRSTWAVLTSALILISGCNPQQPFYFRENGSMSHYVGMATDLEHPDVNQCSLSEVEKTRAPLTLDNARFDETWDLSLEEAVKITLENSKVMRSLGGRITLSSLQTLAARPTVSPTGESVLAGAASNVYSTALQESSPGGLFSDPDSAQVGPEAALAAFDTQFQTSAIWNKTDRMQNSLASPLLQQDVGQFSAGFSKSTASGAQFSIFSNSTYTDRINPDRPISHDWQTDISLGVVQPLLQGAGTTYNRIAGPHHPNSQTNNLGNPQFDGVMLARINTDISLTNFEIGVRNLLTDVENTYLELYFAYRNLEARRIGRDSALATWRTIHAKYCAGSKGGEAEKEYQAREQYHQFKAEVESALSDLFKAENRLRYIMGLSATDGRLIRPKDEPTAAKLTFDWCQVHAEALARSPELRRRKWNIKSDELQLVAMKNLLLPRLDAIAQYRFNGIGEDLISTREGSGQVVGGNAFDQMVDGQFQEWEMGLRFSMPIGFRRELAGVRNRQLKIAQDRALLQDGELELSHQLTDAVRDLDTQYTLMQTNFNRLIASQKQVEAIDAAYQAGAADVTFDVLLNAQRRRSDAEAGYYRALVDYNKAIAQVHIRKGSMMEYNGVYLAEGPWPAKAYFDAEKRARRRDASTYMNYGYTNPQVISRGPVEQFESSDNGASGSVIVPGTPTLPGEEIRTPPPVDGGKMPKRAMPSGESMPQAKQIRQGNRVAMAQPMVPNGGMNRAATGERPSASNNQRNERTVAGNGAVRQSNTLDTSNTTSDGYESYADQSPPAAYRAAAGRSSLQR